MRINLDDLWQLNIELSLLLLLVMAARYAIRKTTRNYNSYLLWASIPLGLLASISVSFIDFSAPPTQFASVVVQSYLVEPVRSTDYSIYFICAWSLVALGLLLRLGFQHVQLRFELNDFTVSGDHRIKSRYPVLLIDKESFSPAVYGFFQPKIYFPNDLISELSERQIRLIIKHEEHHIRQKHLWLNLLWDMLVCCLWFNPIVYIARRCFRHDQELYCDYLALRNANRSQQEDYGLALLSTVSLTQPVSLLCSWKAFNQIEERIMNMKNIKSINVILFAGAVAIIGMTSLYAAGDRPVMGFESEQSEIGVTYLLGLNEKVYIVGLDGVKRLASDTDTANFLKYLTDQASSPTSATEYLINTPDAADLAKSPILEGGDETVNTYCIFYGEGLEQHDECIEIKAGVERTMTQTETIAQRSEQGSK